MGIEERSLVRISMVGSPFEVLDDVPPIRFLPSIFDYLAIKKSMRGINPIITTHNAPGVNWDMLSMKIGFSSDNVQRPFSI